MRQLRLCIVLLAACGGGSSSQPAVQSAPPPAAENPPPAETTPPAESTPPAAAETPPAGKDAEALAADGAQLYADNCASCHGKSGEGKGKAPPLVGKGVLPENARPGQKRNVKFETGADVFTWVKANMPPGKAGTLTDEQYLAILAFDLKANGVDLKGKPGTGDALGAIKLH